MQFLYEFVQQTLVTSLSTALLFCREEAVGAEYLLSTADAGRFELPRGTLIWFSLAGGFGGSIELEVREAARDLVILSVGPGPTWLRDPESSVILFHKKEEEFVRCQVYTTLEVSCRN